MTAKIMALLMDDVIYDLDLECLSLPMMRTKVNPNSFDECMGHMAKWIKALVKICSKINGKAKHESFVTSFPVANLAHECNRPSRNLGVYEKLNKYLYKNNFRKHTNYNNPFKFSICLMEKVGCSFFKRFLYFFRDANHHLKDPFELSLNQAHHVKLESFQGLADADIRHILRNYKNIIFVRDPYSRLFSGYVDKIFSRCNSWRIYNQVILKTIGHATPQRRCANDVTFEEFVMFIIQLTRQGDHVDGHFLPMHRHCKPCQIKYDFVGKLENFEHDIRNMMHLIGLSNYTHVLQKSKEATLQDELEDARYILFKRKTTLQLFDKCFDSYKAALRQWRKLQIKGILSLRIKFPYSQSYWETVNSNQFSDMLLTVHKLSKATDVTLHENKRKAMVEAYQSLSLTTLEKVKKMLEPDCKLFGYDVNPTFLDVKKKRSNPQFFDFRQL